MRIPGAALSSSGDLMGKVVLQGWSEGSLSRLGNSQESDPGVRGVLGVVGVVGLMAAFW